MADRTIGELPSLSTMEDDTLIPVEQAGVAKKMAGSVLNSHVYDLVQDDVTAISQIIAVGPQGEPGISPALSSSKVGKVTTIYYTDADHPTQTVLATLNDGADGSGTGDMVKATYDADGDGIVDDAEKLGGQLPSYYAAASALSNYVPTSDKGANSGVATLDTDGKITPTQATAKQVDISSNTTLTASHNSCRLRVTGTRTITVPSTLVAGFECEIVNYGTGTITIAVSGSTLNGSSTSITSSSKYDVEVLAALTATDWLAKGDFE